jgi:uncharacterized protein
MRRGRASRPVKAISALGGVSRQFSTAAICRENLQDRLENRGRLSLLGHESLRKKQGASPFFLFLFFSAMMFNDDGDPLSGFMDSHEIISIILKHCPNVSGIYVFGTFGTPDERPDSDLDIALLFLPEEAGKKKTLVFSACHDELEAWFGRSVDLIDLREANTVFQNEIITEGRLVYSSNPAETDAFEMQAMSAWQKLNEERAEILEDILKSGRVLQ